MRYFRLSALISAPLLLTQCEDPKPIGITISTPVEKKDMGETASLPEEVSFNEHIQPVLSEYCYHCHGPDEGTRLPEEKPLRLDLAEEAFKPRENGKPVIIKGNAKESYLVKLLHSQDKNTVMPPPESHKTLDANQIALFEKWIDQDAEYQDHWAFIPVEKAELPEGGGWSDQALDRFAEAKLAENGLKPNPEEAPARLYRRLHFDLTGLPPSPEDLAAFEKAAATDMQAAVEAEADRLLATTASAEHFTRYWLDAARYGDTHGIHNDNYRSIWPYRDWVIEAFKQNMRWDQFTIEQIAGDMLPEATLDQKVATGFHRCLPTTGEGGAIAEEYLAIYAQDRVDTTSAVWLGLTMGCASCHDHKFDPITMKDHYSMSAFFRNTPMNAMDRNKADHPPNIFVPIKADRKRHMEVASEIAQTEAAIKDRVNSARSDFDRWAANATYEKAPEIDNSLALHLPLTGAAEKITGVLDGQPLEKPGKLSQIDGPLGKAKVVSDAAIQLGNIASFSHTDKVSYGGFIRIEGKPTGAVIARMDADQAFRGWDLYLANGQIAAHVIDAWPDAAHKIVSDTPLTSGKWHHVMVTYDGSRPKIHRLAIHIDGVAAKTKLTHRSIGQNIETQVQLTLGARSKGDSKLTKGKVAMQDFRFYRRLLNGDEIKDLSTNRLLNDILGTPVAQRTKEQNQKLYDHYLANIDQTSRDLKKQLEALKKEQNEIKGRGAISLIMEEKDEEPFAHLLGRGVYSDKGERVTPETPASLPPMPDDTPRNRLGLVNWLISKDNPLTARVTMNRLWYQLFGTGIAETVEDLGIMGARPSHPKLLDWLAAEFMESGWDHRHMVKTIVTSKTYRQSAKVTPEKLEIDPDNRLLSRGPRYRLDAEQIRDLVLSGSDLLSEKVGGPSVRPYQPEGVWEAVAMKGSNTRHYKRDSGESLYRRSLYTFIKRTAPHPAMEILNATSREVFCVRRELTNTPLQAFVTLNDPQFVEASRKLAELAIGYSAEFDARTDFITTRLLSRTLDDEDRALVKATLETATETFSADVEAAKKLITTGETLPDEKLDAAEVAAWTLVSSQILNLDETLNK